MATVKSNIPNTDCTSFKLTVAAAVVNRSVAGQSIDRCSLRPVLPLDFNINGYLGLATME
jgi:hypothetical protein